MKIRMRTTMAGPKGVHSIGDVIDLPKGEAYALVEGRYADQVGEPEADIESASVAAPENTARARARAR